MAEFPKPILCAHLIRVVDTKLLDLLRSLDPAEWDLPTVAPAWKVRDVAAHLLDSALRKLSLVRDGWVVETPDIRSPDDLAAFINRLNREGVTVYRRLSPPMLIALMEHACWESADFHESLDPFEIRLANRDEFSMKVRFATEKYDRSAIQESLTKVTSVACNRNNSSYF